MGQRPRVVLVSKAMAVPATHSKAQALAADFDLTLVTPERWASYVSERTRYSGSEFTHMELPVILAGHNHFHAYRGIGTLIRRIRPHLVHIDEEPWSLVTTQVVRHAQSINARSVCFTWQNILKTYPPPFGTFQRYVFNRVSRIIAGNGEAQVVLRRQGYAGPIDIVPQFGVDLSLFIAPAVKTTENGLLRVGYIGRLVAEKGVDTLVTALRDVPNAVLSVAGTGPEESRLRQLVKDLDLLDRVTFLGGVKSTDVPKILTELDVLVLPSRTTPRWKEQFGRVLVEAMAMKVCVVGSSSGEIPRVIGDAGLTFAEGDPKHCAAILLSLNDPALRSSLHVQGMLRANAYSSHAVSEDTAAVWRVTLA